jgi:phage repressor protein C with HTH and peptisase S24 domain
MGVTPAIFASATPDPASAMALSNGVGFINIPPEFRAMHQRYVYLINKTSSVNSAFMKNQHSGDRLRTVMHEQSLSPRDLVARLVISPQTLNNWFQRGVPGSRLLAVSAVLGVDPEWLQSGIGEAQVSAKNLAVKRRASVQPESNAEYLGTFDVWDDDTPLNDDEVYVPFLKEVELSAGSGKTMVEQSDGRKLRFGKLTLRRQGVQPSEAVCVTVSGNSMEPVLPDRSTVGVDKGNTSVVDGKMYALDHGGQLRVKTLYRLPGGGIRLRSFNRDEHPDEEYSAQEMIDRDILVLGRVFWSSVLW